MKLRWKILITVLLAVLAVYLQALMDRPVERHNLSEEKAGPESNLGDDKDIPTVSDLLGIFESYNQAFFQNKLPENTIVDWSETGQLMAKTSLVGSQYHISLNLKYASANRVARLMVLHESCHIKTFDEQDEATKNHGPRWRTCMLTIEAEGGNRAILVDGYAGQ